MHFLIVTVLSCLLAFATSRVVPEVPSSFTVPAPRFTPPIIRILPNLTIPGLGGDNPWEWKPPLPADDGQWQRATCKGKTLLQSMRLPDNEAGQLFTPPRDSAESEFRDPLPIVDLLRWNYNIYSAHRISEMYTQLDRFWGIGNALRDLRVSDKSEEEGGNNGGYYIAHGSYDVALPFHEQLYHVDGRQYQSTGAYFSYSINPEDGVIIALNLQSPRHSVANWNPPFPEEGLPRLSKTSDIAFLLWSIFANENIKNVRYFFMLAIKNEVTDRILTRATGGRVTPWPGVTFTADQEKMQALLGTPNGVGIAYFLIQHKARLGHRWIWAVRVFHCDTGHKTPCLLFYITDKWLDEVPGIGR